MDAANAGETRPMSEPRPTAAPPSSDAAPEPDSGGGVSRGWCDEHNAYDSRRGTDHRPYADSWTPPSSDVGSALRESKP